MPGQPHEVLRLAREDAMVQIAALHRDLEGVIDASRSSNADDEHDPEGATIAFERAQVAALLDGARRRLAELDAALERVEAGTFGRCERCGRPIPAERLEIRPSARTCVTCPTH
ncbi:TraR/DksA family transcriptional regulator [Dactylosporangium cerinum]|uniref:TraR/DksA family transcriptional regulator n=1 Tax=Dactylosporangium cerinum TaxID=1434730 RepID=A0ABV9W5L5_9ACTN